MSGKRVHGTSIRGRHPGMKPDEPINDEDAKLKTAAGQVYDTERMDRINDYDADHLQLDVMIRTEMGERKHHKKPIY